MPKIKQKSRLRVIEGGKGTIENSLDRVRLARSELLERQAREEERIRDVERHGGIAEKELDKRRRQKIPMADRRQMAINLDAIVRKYTIKPSDLDWSNDYASPQEFHNAFSRCRLASSGSTKARLNAYPPVWLRITNYIFRSLREKGTSVSRKALLEQLVWGTSYHPMKQNLTQEDLLLNALQSISDKISVERSLMPHYALSAEIRSRYYKTYGKLLDGRPYLGNYPNGYFEQSVGSLFGGVHLWRILPDKKFTELSPEEWKEISSHISEDGIFGNTFSDMNDLFSGECSWIHNLSDEEYRENLIERLSQNVIEYFDLRVMEKLDFLIEKPVCDLDDAEWDLLLAEKSASEHELGMLQLNVSAWNGFHDRKKSILTHLYSSRFDQAELEQFSHAFLGLYSYSMPVDGLDRVIDRRDEFWSEFFSDGLTETVVEKIRNSEDSDHDGVRDMFVYLILVPNFERNQLVPHLCGFYDGSWCRELTAKILCDEEDLLLPMFEPDSPWTVTPTKEIILDQIERIRNELEDSSDKVKQADPYIIWERDRTTKLEAIVNELWTD